MRIKKSRLLMTFEKLCQELETRSLREVDVCAAHTRFGDKTAYSLSIGRHGLFVIVTADDAVKHIRLITMKLLAGNERTTDAEIHVIHEDDVRTMAFLTTHFFYEGMRPDNFQDLYQAFPDIDSHRHVVQVSRETVDLHGYLA
jgi:hypothetical protein